MTPTPPLPRFRDPRLSLWQSSVAKVLRREVDDSTSDAILHDPMMRAASFAAVPFEGLSPGDPLPTTPTPTVAAVAAPGVDPADRAPASRESCAALHLKLIFTHDPARRKAIEEEIAAFGHCDPRWAEVVAAYEANLVLCGQRVPYIPPTGPGDSVIDALPGRATIGLISDWGTGSTASIELLKALAAMRTPGVPFFLVHLGDIYYSGTSHEVGRFVANCRDVVGAEAPIFTMAGNHDMYSGGRAYYDAIAGLNPAPFRQRTSYFNLRNAHWQIQAMDTALNDRDPIHHAAAVTRLDPAEADWHRRQLDAAAGRKVVLLSHHQPFSAFAKVGGGHVNDLLLDSFNGLGPGGDGVDRLPAVAAWLWGHEHITAVYGPYAGVARGRCIGSGAIPVAVADAPYAVGDPSIPFEASALLDDDGAVFSHGFAVLEIDGPRGTISYIQVPDPHGRNPIWADRFDA